MSEAGADPFFRIMTRARCSLCDHLVLALELLRPRYTFTYTLIDVDGDPELALRYGTRVPVLIAGDSEICAGHCEPSAIEAYLRGCAER